MLARKKIYLVFLILIIFSGFSLESYSQYTQVGIDTSDYLPYPYGIDYNLIIAASRGYTEEVKRLIRLGADIEIKTYESATPLMFAVANNHIECVNVLLSNGADPDVLTSNFETPLLSAVKNNNLEIAEALIRKNANIKVTDGAGASPLHYSSVYGYLSVSEMLLYYHAPVNLTANDGTTPIMSSVWAGYPDITDLLINNGADVNKKDNYGFSPYLIAAQNGDTLIMSLLADSGADIYAINNFGFNALCIAIKENHPEAVRYLLHQGNLWKSSFFSATDPESVAIKYSRRDILKLLEEYNMRSHSGLNFNQLSISASGNVTSHDFFTGLSIKVKEPKLNAGIFIGSDFKLYENGLIIKTGESLYYQYMDRRSVVYAGLFKDINLEAVSLKGTWALSASVAAAYTFGNQYKGTNLSPTENLKIIPSLYLKYERNKIELFGGLDYMKTKYYKVGPGWLRLGITYNFFFDKVRSPEKVIKWY